MDNWSSATCGNNDLDVALNKRSLNVHQTIEFASSHEDTRECGCVIGGVGKHVGDVNSSDCVSVGPIDNDTAENVDSEMHEAAAKAGGNVIAIGESPIKTLNAGYAGNYSVERNSSINSTESLRLEPSECVKVDDKNEPSPDDDHNVGKRVTQNCKNMEEKSLKAGYAGNFGVGSISNSTESFRHEPSECVKVDEHHIGKHVTQNCKNMDGMSERIHHGEPVDVKIDVQIGGDSQNTVYSNDADVGDNPNDSFGGVSPGSKEDKEGIASLIDESKLVTEGDESNNEETVIFIEYSEDSEQTVNNVFIEEKPRKGSQRRKRAKTKKNDPENLSEPLQSKTKDEECRDAEPKQKKQKQKKKKDLGKKLKIQEKEMTMSSKYKEKLNPIISLKCEFCGKEFERSTYLIIHRRMHTGEKPFKCQECEKCFTRKGTLKEHARTHTGEKPYTCDVCDKQFTAHSTCKQHKHHYHTGIDFQCPNCPEKHDNIAAHKKHLKLHDEEQRYKCQYCGKWSGTIQALNKHESSHDGRDAIDLVGNSRTFCCKVCGKLFAQLYDLERHFLRHTDNKKYKCALCELAFFQNSDLQRHVQTHSDEKPFQCDVCHKCFRRKDSLKSHLATHEKKKVGHQAPRADEDKPFKCEICGKGFLVQSSLVRHTKAHTGEQKKVSTCDVCGKTFTQSCDLARHIRLHTGEKPFTCDVCGRSFSRADTLKVHSRKHRNDVLGQPIFFEPPMMAEHNAALNEKENKEQAPPTLVNPPGESDEVSLIFPVEMTDNKHTEAE